MTTSVTQQFDEDAATLWGLLGDFPAIDNAFPDVVDVEATDDERTFSMLGMRLRERLVDRDAAARRLSYSLVEGIDLEHHLATIVVEPRGEGCEVTWQVEVRPEAAEPLFADTYRGALAALRNRLS